MRWWQVTIFAGQFSWNICRNFLCVTIVKLLFTPIISPRLSFTPLAANLNAFNVSWLGQMPEKRLMDHEWWLDHSVTELCKPNALIFFFLLCLPSTYIINTLSTLGRGSLFWEAVPIWITWGTFKVLFRALLTKYAFSWCLSHSLVQVKTPAPMPCCISDLGSSHSR